MLDLFGQGVGKGDRPNDVKILISDTKGRKDEGDFMGAEMMLSVVLAGIKKAESPCAKLVSLYNTLGESLYNSKPKGGFAAEWAKANESKIEAFMTWQWLAK